MILQTFAKDVCHHINCETDGGPGLFWTDPRHNFVTNALDRNINSLKKIIWLK